MSLFLALAGLRVVGEVLRYFVRPAVGDGVAFGVETLGDADLAIGFVGGARVLVGGGG